MEKYPFVAPGYPHEEVIHDYGQKRESRLYITFVQIIN